MLNLKLLIISYRSIDISVFLYLLPNCIIVNARSFNMFISCQYMYVHFKKRQWRWCIITVKDGYNISLSCITPITTYSVPSTVSIGCQLVIVSSGRLHNSKTSQRPWDDEAIKIVEKGWKPWELSLASQEPLKRWGCCCISGMLLYLENVVVESTAFWCYIARLFNWYYIAGSFNWCCIACSFNWCSISMLLHY